MRHLLLICLLSLICFGTAFAEDVRLEDEHLYIYEFPEIKPEYFLAGGIRYIDIKGSDRAAEYEYPDNSIFFGGEYRALPFPHRLHIELDFLNKKDYFGDLSYAYKDIVLTRWISRSIFHNLENIRLIDAGTHERFSIDVTDAFEKYDITSNMNSVFVRFKAPDYPLHVYVNGHVFNKDGKKQQRFLGGSGYYNDLKRITAKRDVDWRSSHVNVGINTHLGPVEFDISHAEKRFDSRGDNVLYDFYRSGDSRAAGLYPHNSIPDSKGSKNTLAIHTSYTGKLVASLTLANYNRRNENIGAKADYFLGNADVTWMPVPKLTFFIKYRHRETDTDNPDTVTITDLLDPSNSYTYSVRPSISSKKDSISGIIRYRAFKGVTFHAQLSHVNTERENADEWKLSETTVKDTASLSVVIRIMKKLHLKSSYIHEEIDAPSYNIESDRKDKGKVSLSWTPLPTVFTYLSYDSLIGKRDNISYTVSDQQVIVGDGDISSGKIFGMIGVSIAKNISVDTSYAYINNKTTQPLIYGSDNAPQYINDANVPYKEKTHTIAANLNYRPTKDTDLLTGISYTESKANFVPYAQEAVETVSIADFSELKIQQIGFTLQGQYEFRKGWDIGLRYFYSDFNYIYNNPLNPFEDSCAHIVLLRLSKRWE